MSLKEAETKAAVREGCKYLVNTSWNECPKRRSNHTSRLVAIAIFAILPPRLEGFKVASNEPQNELIPFVYISRIDD
jgi:hypothetical protein